MTESCRKIIEGIAERFDNSEYTTKEQLMVDLFEVEQEAHPEYTAKAPESDGYYWYREDPNGKGKVIRVYLDDDTKAWMAMLGNGSVIHRGALNGFYAEVQEPK